MTMSISAKKADGTFGYEVWNGSEMIEAGAGYPSQQAALAAAHVCYHELHRVNFQWNKPFFQNDYMTLDEIFAELEDLE